MPVPTDVSDETAVSAAVESVIDEFGRIDTVVSNAGVSAGEGSSIPEVDMDDFETVNAVNIDGTFYVVRNTMDHLAETSGTLIFVGSFDGHYPRPDNPIYTASKWWLRGFAHSIEVEAGDRDIGVPLVRCPGVGFGGRNGRFSPLRAF